MSYRDYEPVDLAGANFKIHQLESLERDNIENAFAGYVRAVIGRINQGKEATVYLCQGEAGELLAAKVFKSRNFRHFNNDHSYRNLNRQRDRRMAKAMKKRSRTGDASFHKAWIKSEWRYLNELYELGVRVPRPLAESSDGVLMEFIGDSTGAAPRLVNASFDSTAEVERCALSLYDGVRLMIAAQIVHGDLSAYNVLYHRQEPVIIDVPQAMPLFDHPEAFAMMQRDLENLDRFFERCGVNVGFVSLLM